MQCSAGAEDAALVRGVEPGAVQAALHRGHAVLAVVVEAAPAGRELAVGARAELRLCCAWENRC